ncbi:tektin-4 [Diorhabda carinulata]|uniref:tektin-4 n=1 Tax=Diorhabda carinulata TaxID=1163345 RepID=UPI0025A02A16|nr:tektin-4 [Diorhabda carinulata]
MAEYPPRYCGPCPHLAQFVPKNDTSYIEQNTTPEPNVQFKDVQGNNQPSLGVNSSDLKPDLTVPPVREVKFSDEKDKADGGYKGGIPPCTKNELDECGNVEQKPAKQENLKSILKKDTGPKTAEEMYAQQSVTAPIQKRPEQPEQQINPPCYLPQPNDSLPHPLGKSMGPIGPWATGRVDWGPLSGLTGIRPVVDKYSIARYSEGDWRSHNKEVLDMATREQHRANLIDWNGRQCLTESFTDVDKNQADNTKRLNQRELELHRWKCELERAIAAASEEITFMEEQRHRLKQASKVLTLPESISGESLERRTGRMDAELVRDEVEEEVMKEVALCAEIREIFSRTLKDVEKQLLEDKTAKQRLEYDWSDKKVSHEIDSINMALNNRSTVLMFKPGAVRFPDEQSTPDYWEHFTRETLLEGEATRQRSVTLRGTLDDILNNASKDLRAQADRVEAALAKRVACAQEVTKRLEDELKGVLKRLADVEDLKESLREAIRRLDTPMKKAQTRLDNRLLRPRVENCRDNVHFSLIEEVKSIGESVAALQAQLAQVEDSQGRLMKARSDLEREIMLKMKTLEIDNQRTRRIRSYYPSAAALSGH